MQRYVITGASGHIGNNLVRLINRCEPNALVVVPTRRRIEQELQGTICTQVVGDLCDAEFLSSVLQKDDIVVHLAGLIDLSDRLADQMYRINFELTQTVCRLCLEKEVKRLVYVGSVDGIAKGSADEIICEPAAFFPEQVEGCYGKTKAMAMQYVWELIQQEPRLSAAMVLPSAVIGIHDHKPSAVGTVIQSTLNGRAELGIKGGYDFVSVADVCDAIYTLCNNSLRDRYILSGGAVSVQDLYGLINREMGYRRRPIILPKWLIYPFLPFVRVLNKTTLKALCEPHAYSSQKARAELGYSPRSAEIAVLEAVRWFAEEKKSNRVPISLHFPYYF